MGDCWQGGGGDGSWGWEAADVACTSYAGVGVGRLGGGLGRVNEVEHGARHCAFWVWCIGIWVVEMVCLRRRKRRLCYRIEWYESRDIILCSRRKAWLERTEESLRA